MNGFRNWSWTLPWLGNPPNKPIRFECKIGAAARGHFRKLKPDQLPVKTVPGCLWTKSMMARAVLVQFILGEAILFYKKNTPRPKHFLVSWKKSGVTQPICFYPPFALRGQSFGPKNRCASRDSWLEWNYHLQKVTLAVCSRATPPHIPYITHTFISIGTSWNAKCTIFLGNFTPKTSNYCLKNRALGFPGW